MLICQQSIFLLMMSSLLVSSVHAKHILFQKDVQVIKNLESRNSYLVLVQDAYNNKYLIKQNKDFSLVRLARHILCEALSAYIASRVDIPCQHVWVVSGHQYADIKKYPTFPASVHSYIDGVHISNRRFPFDKNIKLRQLYSDTRHVYTGLTLEVLQSVAAHPDLVKIIALDTFTGNGDRTKHNILYVLDKGFFAIDMDPTFRKNLAQCAYAIIKQWINDSKIVFTHQELSALQLYKCTLQKIIDTCTQAQLYTMCDVVVQQLSIKTPYKFDFVVKESIRKTLISTRKLIKILDQLIAKKNNVHREEYA